MDDSIHLHLFQQTLTGSAAKWYIELPQGFFSDFNILAMAFLTHYQLPIHYNTGTEILTSFKQTKGTHISDHIHEWRQRRCLIKLKLPDQLLAEWFTKSFMNEIGKDISMGGVVTEEHAISCAQYLDLVYSQMGTLYDLLHELPHLGTSNTSTAPATSHAADGVIGTAHTHSHSVSNTTPKSNSSNVQSALSPAPPAGKTSEVNAVQSTPTGKNKSKKGRVKIIIEMNKPKPLLLMIAISVSHDILSLSVVTITTQRIVLEVSKSTSSFKERPNPLRRQSCPNPSRLSNKPPWSFTTNHILLRHHMF
jgi:hypothetical protein